jgi:hypothetical protein
MSRNDLEKMLFLYFTISDPTHQHINFYEHNSTYHWGRKLVSLSCCAC